MPFGPAYFSDAIRDPCAARDSDVFRRLAYGGPWSFADANHGGKRGILAFWDDGKGVPLPTDYGSARTCADGLIYFSPSPMTGQADLAKSDALPGIDYTTSRGATLTIPWATSASLEINFSSGKLGNAADEFARLAWDIWDERATIQLGDPRILHLVYVSIAQNYRLTAELLDDLRWLTSRDIDPIFARIMGYDPKAFADAETSSPSTASAQAVTV